MRGSLKNLNEGEDDSRRCVIIGSEKVYRGWCGGDGREKEAGGNWKVKGNEAGNGIGNKNYRVVKRYIKEKNTTL